MFFKGSAGILTTLGVIGGSSVSVAGSSLAGRETVMHSSGTRGPLPTMSGSRAPSVNVGGGGRGAPMRSTDTPQQRRSEREEGSVSEQVGRIIDQSNQQSGERPSADDRVPEGQTGEDAPQEEEQVQRNPKKRMWEEEKEAPKEAQRVRDEL